MKKVFMLLALLLLLVFSVTGCYQVVEDAPVRVCSAGLSIIK